jgi:dTDP-4-amino-4,6-dideoxygalactose transaminase
VTNNEALKEKIEVLRDHGQIRKYHHSVVGWNGRMDGIQAAVLRVKLRHLEAGNELRRSHARSYNRMFEDLSELITPVEAKNVRHVYHVYAIRVQQRDEVMWQLTKNGIGCGVHYPVPVHLQEAYWNLNYQLGSFPVAEQSAREFISLPMFPELKDDQIDAVVGAVREAVSVGAIS